MIHHYKTVAALLLLPLLAACGDQKAPAPSAQAPVAVAAAPKAAAPSASEQLEAALMKAVYAKQYRSATNDALAQLPVFYERTKQRLFVVKPLASKVFKTGETVLVALASPAEEDANGNFVGFDDIGLLNVFVLRQTKGEWTVLKRHVNVAYRGDDNRPGSILFPMLGKDKPGLAVISGGKRKPGCEVESLLLFDLSADPITDLAGEIRTKWVMNESCDDDSASGYGAFTSKWRLAASSESATHDDLIVVYSGERTPATEMEGGRAVPGVRKSVSGTNRYVYDGTHYQLVDGKRPMDDEKDANHADE